MSLLAPLFLPRQALAHIPLQEGVEDGGHRHTEEDAGQVEEAAAHGDSGEDPDAGQAQGGAHHPGVDDVALDLLEAGQEDEEDEEKSSKATKTHTYTYESEVWRGRLNQLWFDKDPLNAGK